MSPKPHFHELAEVAVGAPVMVTTNQNQDKGVVNGAIGTVMELRRIPNSDITSVRVWLDDATHTYVHRSVEKTFTNLEKGQRHTLRTFLLRLSYARTAYSAHSATLRGRVYIHIYATPSRAGWRM